MAVLGSAMDAFGQTTTGFFYFLMRYYACFNT